jgi:hypothetical protein
MPACARVNAALAKIVSAIPGHAWVSSSNSSPFVAGGPDLRAEPDQRGEGGGGELVAESVEVAGLGRGHGGLLRWLMTIV